MVVVRHLGIVLAWVLALIVPGVASAQFFENFEGGAAGWTLQSGWNIVDCGSGDKCLRLTASDVPVGQMAAATWTSSIDLTGVDAPGLRILSVAGKTSSSTCPDYVEVQESTDGGSTWRTMQRGSNGTFPEIQSLGIGGGTSATRIRFVYRDGDGSNATVRPTWDIKEVQVVDRAFAVIAPDGGMPVAGGKTMVVRWGLASSLGATSFDIDAITESGPLPIATGVASTARSYTWAVPTVTFSTVRVRVTARTPTGDVVAQSPAAFAIDSTSPAAFSLTSPANGASAPARPTFTWAASSGALIYGVDLSGVRIGEVASTSGGTVSWSPPTDLAAGVYTWTVVARDGAGNDVSALQTYTVRISPVPPEPFSLTTPVDNAWIARSQVFRWESTLDLDVGLAGYEFWMDGTPCQTSLTGTSASLPAAVSTPCSPSSGSHIWQVRAKDLLGNVRIADPIAGRTVRIDSTAPTLVGGGGSGTTTTHSVNGLHVPTTGTSTGVSVVAGDRVQVSATGTACVDSCGLSGCYGPSGGGSGSAYTSSCAWGALMMSVGSSSWQCVGAGATITATTSGVIRLGLNDDDSSNCSTPSMTVSLVVGNRGATYLSETGWSADPQPFVSWDEMADSESGIAGYNIEIDGAVQGNVGPNDVGWGVDYILSDGMHTVRAVGYDAVGNATVTAPVTAMIDTTPPAAFSLTQPNSCSPLLTPQLCWRPATDVHAGVSHYELWVDGALVRDDVPKNGTADVCVNPLLTTGTHTWYAVAVDVVGNERPSSNTGRISVAGAVEVCDGLDTNCDGTLPADERDVDADGVATCQGDCDDANANRKPGKAEVCDGLDNDCDTVVPAGEVDGDGDGTLVCAGDCNDALATVRPGLSEACDGLDNNCDGTTPANETDGDGDGFRVCANDCADGDALRAPGKPERCNGLDDDCNGVVPVNEADADGDAYRVCAGDCADNSATRFPGAPELCNGVDDDCVGGVPANEADADFDGTRVCAGDCDDTTSLREPGRTELCDGVDNDCVGGVPANEVDGDGDGARVCALDCDDADPSRRPGISELCNGIDDDCSGSVPSNESDADGDSFRVCDDDCADADDQRYPGATERCNDLDDDCDGNAEVDLDRDGFAECEGDCDDEDELAYPGANELCDLVDNNCDGSLPDDEDDIDGDGFVACEDDCDDTDPDIFPDADEGCDGVDSNCDGKVPPRELDFDGDGEPKCRDCDDEDAERAPGTPEICADGIDNDCDDETPDTCDDTDIGGDTDSESVTDDEERCGGCSTAGQGASPLLLLGLVALRRRRARR